MDVYRVGVAETRDRTIVFVPFVITWIGLLGASHASVFSNKSLVSKRYEFSKSIPRREPDPSGILLGL